MQPCLFCSKEQGWKLCGRLGILLYAGNLNLKRNVAPGASAQASKSKLGPIISLPCLQPHTGCATTKPGPCSLLTHGPLQEALADEEKHKEESSSSKVGPPSGQ